MQTKIMIIEDDPIIFRMLKKELEHWSYDIFAVSDYQNILAEIRQIQPHLILLDITLPSKNGYYWCTQIRKESKVPIIFISSKSDKVDQVMAMQLGADDYIIKPFDITVLVAKIQALLRRSYDFVLEDNRHFDKHGFILDINQAQCSYANKTIELTKTELQILSLLFQHFNEFVSRDLLLNHCWQDANFIDDNTLSVNMHRLRKKLAAIGLADIIETRLNIGYRLCEKNLC